ncbi:PREDICTED: mitochondrial fission 1 protein A-like, partial [Nicotiana attenuata]|uniref:mitochondrial fission 1 protein A-like n=1 Tax=Nicotiana attenuata TaxID=49451 RepID=UPI000905A504
MKNERLYKLAHGWAQKRPTARTDWLKPEHPKQAGCEREAADATNGVRLKERMRVLWALVHSKQPEDVQRGMAMLEVSPASSNSPLQKREKLYLLAVGYYRSGEYSRSRELTGHCLEFLKAFSCFARLRPVLVD